MAEKVSSITKAPAVSDVHILVDHSRLQLRR